MNEEMGPERFLRHIFEEAVAGKLLTPEKRARLLEIWSSEQRADHFRMLGGIVMVVAGFGAAVAAFLSLCQVLSGDTWNAVAGLFGDVWRCLGAAAGVAHGWFASIGLWLSSLFSMLYGAVVGALAAVAVFLAIVWHGLSAMAAAVWTFAASVFSVAFMLADAVFICIAGLLRHTPHNSEVRILLLLLASVLCNGAARLFAKHARSPRLIKPARIAGAAFFTWMAGHIIEYCVVAFGWDGLETASMALWCAIPLLFAAMSAVRPLACQLFTLGMLGLHILVFYCGISGNAFLAFDLSLAATVVAVADLFRS